MGYQHWPTDFSNEIRTPLLIKKTKKTSLRERIPARYVLTLLTFLGLGIQYTQRVNLNVTIVAMVDSSVNQVQEANYTSSSECPNLFLDDNNSNDTLTTFKEECVRLYS